MNGKYSVTRPVPIDVRIDWPKKSNMNKYIAIQPDNKPIVEGFYYDSDGNKFQVVAVPPDPVPANVEESDENIIGFLLGENSFNGQWFMDNKKEGQPPSGGGNIYVNTVPPPEPKREIRMNFGKNLVN